jgi:hypothetical protein
VTDVSIVNTEERARLSIHFFQVIHRLQMLHVGDEIHHMGWNACSSCHDNPSRSRNRLIAPTLHSDRVYIIDVSTDPKAPRIHKVSPGGGDARYWVGMS